MRDNVALIKNSIYLITKLIVTLIVSLYCSRLILQELGVVDYGIYNVVGGIVTMLTFVTGSMAQATQRFFSFDLGKDAKSINKVYSTSINIYMLIIFVVLIISQTIGLWAFENVIVLPEERIESAYWVYQISVLTFVFAIISLPFNALMLAYERMKVYSIFGMVSIVLKLIMVLSLSLFQYEKIIVYSFLILVLNLVMTMMPIFYKVTKIPEVKYERYFDKGLSKRILSYSGWNLFGSLSAVGMNQGGNILLNTFFGPSINASRAIAMQVNSAIVGFTSNINTAINPQIVKRYSSEDYTRMKTLILNGARYSTLVMIVIGTPILFFTEQLILFWLGSVPDYTVMFTKLVIIDSIICSLSGTLITTIQATGKIRNYQIVVGGILLCNIPISYYLLSNDNNPSIPLVVMIFLSILAMNARLYFARKFISLSYREFYLKVIYRSAIALIFSFGSIYLALYYVNVNFLISFPLSFVFSAISVVIFGLDKQEKIFLASLAPFLKLNKLN